MRHWCGRLGVALVLCLGAGVAIWLMAPPYRGDLKDYRATVTITDRRGIDLRLDSRRHDTFCLPIGLDDCGEWTARALIAAEDKRFYDHAGVDAIAVCRAAAQNVICRRVVSGASTLSMLVGKLTEPRKRTLWTKIVEAKHAFEIESELDKNAILEQFLNRAPFGGNIRGIEAASRFYFGKSARDLTLAESAMLVGLPQSPSRLRPDRFPAAAQKRKEYVLRRMAAAKLVGESDFKRAMAEELILAHRPQPFLAPHFADLVIERSVRRERLKTTLDLDMQAAAESALARRLGELAGQGVHGGAVVILDVKKSAVRAMVGSPSYWNEAHAGQVNMAIARRSPGSALKPFIYGMALEQGMYTPATVLADVPLAFPGYRPDNFDRGFRGAVSVRESLVQSLNIPALNCVRQVGLQPVVERLRAAGIATLNEPASRYGAGIAIGSCEVTLLELVNAYACLARGGIRKQLRLLEDDGEEPGSRVFSPEAAWMISEILGGYERQAEICGHCGDVAAPRVAWKTGTSSGYRDAWTVMWNPDYVVGVWLGNPDGRPSEALKGSRASVAAYDIFRRIHGNAQAPWFKKPAGVGVRKVCAKNGHLANGHCPVEVNDYYLPGVSRCEVCDLHRKGKGSSGVVEAWSADLKDFLADNGLSGGAPVRKSCDRAGPRIASPVAGESFRYLEDAPHLRQEVQLTARVDSGPVYWFVDGEFLQKAESGKTVFWPLRRGKHTMVCSDAEGNSRSVGVEVE